MINVIPTNDERKHVLSTECWCSPWSEWVDTVTGIPHANGPIVVHKAADCREFSERITGAGVSDDKKWQVIHD